MNLTSPKIIKELLNCHGFNFSKSLGQNFLINPEIPEKIVSAARISEQSVVLEIGPGIGCLTSVLAQRAKRVIAVEIDSRLIPVLTQTLASYKNVDVICADILKTDIEALSRKFGSLTVCANLPYYITTPILMYLLESKANITSITIMVQKEVAQRLCANAGCKEYGAISAAVQYYTDPEIMFSVAKGNFIPAPKIESAVVNLKCRQKPNVQDESFLFSIIRAGFSQRRKTLANAISSKLTISKTVIEKNLASLGFCEDARAERLTIEDFCHLADRLLKKEWEL